LRSCNNLTGHFNLSRVVAVSAHASFEKVGVSNAGINSISVVFYNKLPWLVSELPEKDTSNVGIKYTR
jgi:hypothetical protein